MKKYLILILIQTAMVACTGGGFKSISSLVSSTQLSSSSVANPAPSPSPSASPSSSVAPQVSQLRAQSIVANQWLQQGSIQLKLQTDGNLVMTKDSAVLWTSHTSGRDCSSGCVASLGEDGNITLTQNGKLYFQTATGGHTNVSYNLQASAPHLVVSSDQGTVALGTSTSCQITIGPCPAHSELANTTVVDILNNASGDQNACATRAQDFYQYCGGAIAMVGQTLSSTFYSGETVLATHAAGGVLPDLPSTASVSLSAQVNRDAGQFKKYIYSFPLPAGTTGTVGIHGSLHAGVVNGEQGTSEFNLLATIGSSPAACALNGQSFGGGNYQAIEDALGINEDQFNKITLATFIVKGLYNDQKNQSINFSFPAALPVGGCAFIIMDGGFVGDSHLRMESHLVLDLINNGPATAVLVAPGDEFCTGMQPNTCGFISTPQKSGNFLFARSIPIETSGTLLALYGSISNQTIPGQGTSNQAWGTTHDFYIDRKCSHPTPWTSGDFSAQASEMTKVANVQFRDPAGTQGVLQSPIYQSTFINVNAGDCIVHFLSVSSDSASLSSETQIHALIQPGVVNQFASNPGYDTQGIYRFFNTTNGLHLYSVINNEVSLPTWFLENKGAPVLKVVSQNNQALTMNLNRCVVESSGLHFASISPDCEGQHFESSYGAIYQRQKNQTSALYRFFIPSNGDHLISTDLNEGLKAGGEMEAVLGCVPN